MEVTHTGAIIADGHTPAKVVIGQCEQLDIAIAVIKKEFGLANSHGYYHRISASGEDLELVTDHGHHRGGEEVDKVRPATMLDKAALLMMAELEKHKYGKSPE